MPYSEHIEALAPLETFDPQVFIADEETPQSVCSFILALALVYNDLRDVAMAHVLLKETSQPGRSASPSRGQYGGLLVRIIRQQVGDLHELLSLIDANTSAIKERAFRALIKSMSRKDRHAWDALFTAATAQPSWDPLVRALLLIRNKVAFHYDPKEVLRGYREHFVSSSKGPPFVSRGSSMMETRFYFADAAAEAYLLHRGAPHDTREFLPEADALILQVNHALHEIVTRFPASRGFAWLKHREPA